DKDIISRIKEAEKWMQSQDQPDPKKSWREVRNKTGYDEKLEQFNYLVGYLTAAKDKLQDELVFKEEDSRNVRVKMRKMYHEIESRKSMLEEIVEKRDVARKAYNQIKTKKNNIAKEDKNYILIREEYHKIKKKKESAENTARNHAQQYGNTLQNLKLIEISVEQSRMSLKDDKKIIACIDDAIENINAFYHQIVNLM
ncbi:MAG: hypothetical protein KAS15_01955, partial [Nanoarchaeota archaeon]|nr:hypothetical protein [Nanoarchaeota archaeon]